MGSQQLLLIVLVGILIGIATAIGYWMLVDEAVSQNRDRLSADLATLASRAQEYYKRPSIVGGGGRSFTGLSDLRKIMRRNTNANGEFSVVSATINSLVLRGLGVEEVSNGSLVEIRITVYPDSTSYQVVN